MAEITAIQNPTYQPSRRTITAITNAPLASITTSFNHQYLSGTIVRIYVPIGFGMQQINQQEGEIVVTSPTTFTIAIDTTAYDTFAVPMSNVQYAQCVPVGELSDTLKAATQNVLNPLGN